MNSPAPEDSLAALREEIRRAGRSMTALRLLYLMACSAAAFGLVLLASVLLQVSPGRLLFPGTVALAVTASGLLLGRHRRVCRNGLRARVRALPAREASALLKSLAGEGDLHTARLLDELARDLNLPTELTPAGTPEGSGAEVCEPTLKA
jgi:hypothetical protein